jgi:hypothetical protein
MSLSQAVAAVASSSSSDRNTVLAWSCVGIASGALLALAFGHELNLRQTSSTHTVPIETKPPVEYPPEIKHEFLSRVRSFFGDEGLEKINNSYVVVSSAHHAVNRSLQYLQLSLSLSVCWCVCVLICVR